MWKFRAENHVVWGKGGEGGLYKHCFLYTGKCLLSKLVHLVKIEKAFRINSFKTYPAYILKCIQIHCIPYR